MAIIGGIITSVAKGKGPFAAAVATVTDIINSAKSKQLASNIMRWRILTDAFKDRNGRMPGDSSKSGIIGNNPSTDSVSDGTTIAEIVMSMKEVPANPLVMGDMSFFIYFGNSGDSSPQNVMVICKDTFCTNTFTNDELSVIKMVDVTVDGVSDSLSGHLTAVTLSTGAITLLGKGLSEQKGRINNVVTSVGMATSGSPKEWDTTAVAAVLVL